MHCYIIRLIPFSNQNMTCSLLIPCHLLRISELWICDHSVTEKKRLNQNTCRLIQSHRKIAIACSNARGSCHKVVHLRAWLPQNGMFSMQNHSRRSHQNDHGPTWPHHLAILQPHGSSSLFVAILCLLFGNAERKSCSIEPFLNRLIILLFFHCKKRSISFSRRPDKYKLKKEELRRQAIGESCEAAGIEGN
jgi:hypothetical protein